MDRPFLGHGITRPFRRDQKLDVANASGLALVRACVAQVIGTAASDGAATQGELPWRPEFGSKLYKLRHRKGHLLDALAATFIGEALGRWEPRVRFKGATVTRRTLGGAAWLDIDVVYDVIDRNVPGNQVLYSDVTQRVTISTEA